MITRINRFWIATITSILMVAFVVGCKDEDVEKVGLCPEVLSTDPTDLETGVALDKVITVTFNEPMSPTSITPSVLSIQGGTPGGRLLAEVSGSMSYDATTATISFTPNDNLTANTTYTGTVAASVKDMMGNSMQEPYVWTFSTGSAPTVISTDPVNLATNVPLNKIITANFNEAMNAATITSSSFTLKAGAVSVAGVVTYAGTTATFTPNVDLLPGVVYTATITSLVKNALGTPLASNYVWTFNTGGTPSVISTDPINLAVGVLLDKVISATFSTAMDANTITNLSFTLKRGVTAVVGTINYAGTTATFTPNADLLPGEIYTAAITTLAKSSAGIALAANHTWTFTTGAAPTVILTDPLDLETNVPLDQVISADFSEVMNPATITAASFTLMEGANVISGVVNYAGTTATFTPDVDLSLGTVYTANFTTVVESAAGIPLENNYNWSFTTGVTPTVISTDPDDLEIDVQLDKVISATFSELMNGSTVTSASFTLMEGLNSVSGVVNYAGSTATFTPDVDLLPGLEYTATLSTAIESVSGNALANDYVWTFTAINNIPPTVISTDPADLETGVALDKIITAEFSEAMDLATIDDLTFILEVNGVLVPGSVSYLGTTATFTPTDNLLSDSTYTATITTGAENLAGTPLENDYVWTFNTVAPLGPDFVDMGSVAAFGIIAGVGVSNNAGPSVINDLDVGIYPGFRSSITGFFDVDGGPGLINNGDFFAADDLAPAGVAAMLLLAKDDLVAAYDFAEGAVFPVPVVISADMGTTTLAPGIYKSATTMLIQNGDLTLDAQGDVNAVWIFQIGSALTTTGGAGGNVILAGGAQARNIFWQVTSSATIGDNTSFKGNVLALSDITMGSGSVAEGRMLARNGSVVMTNANTINKPQ